jgi:DNA-directed RNA polymerase subunit L
MSHYEITNVKYEKGSLQFILKGSREYGLDKSYANAIRRTLLNDIPTVAFETSEDVAPEERDLTMVVNHSALHNEMLTHRIAMVPLYLDPTHFHKNLFFECHVIHDGSEPFRFITADDMEVYPLRPDLQQRLDDILDPNVALDDAALYEMEEVLATNSRENYDISTSKRLSKADKERLLRPFEFQGTTSYCLINELKHTGTQDVFQEVHFHGSPSVKTAKHDSRYQAVSQAAYSFVKDEATADAVLEGRINGRDIAPEDEARFRTKFKLAESARYFKRDDFNEPNEYLFKLKSTHFWSEAELFQKTLDILENACESLKGEFLKLLRTESSSITVNAQEEGRLTYTLNGQSHTMGNLLQSHLVRRVIQKSDGTHDEGALLLSCGYKKPHPLEDSLKLFVTVNLDNETIRNVPSDKHPERVTECLMREMGVLKEEFGKLQDVAAGL